MADPTIRTIPLTNLLLDVSNPRYPPQDSQPEILEAIVKDQGIKLVKLAEDIAARGLNPSELLLVAESDETGKYTVLEGNRRIAAIQLASSLNRIKSVKSLSLAQAKRLNALAKIKNSNLPKKISCVVIAHEDLNSARYWIQLRHTGENGGVGIVSWDNIQQDRFLSQSKARGKSVQLQLYELVKEGPYLDEETKQKRRVALTTIRRILNNKKALQLLGIQIIDETLIVPDDADVLKRLAMMVKDIATRYIRVPDVYHSDDQVKYVNELIARQQIETTGQSNTDGSPSESEDKPATETNNGSQSNSDKSPTSTAEAQAEQQPIRINPKRKTLIPDDFNIRINQNKINSIYHELQTLDLDKFTNSGAVMLQSLLN